MSDNRRDSKGETEYLRAMSAEKLDDLIRTVSLADEIDVEFLDKLLAVAAEREPAADSGAAWEEFQRVYSGQQEIYPIGEVGNTTQTIDSDAQKKPRRRRGLFRVATVAAVIASLLFAGTITASAFGYDLWGAVARWTAETFGFSPEGASENQNHEIDSDLRYDNLQSAVDSLRMDVRVVPKWLPDGFALDECGINVMEEVTEVYAWYINGDSEILVLIKERHASGDATYEKDDAPVTEYIAGGVCHYLMTNLGEELASWANGNLECSISGNISREELVLMVDSIYER